MVSEPLAATELPHGGTYAEASYQLAHACNSQYIFSEAPTSSFMLGPADYGTGPAKEEQGWE